MSAKEIQEVLDREKPWFDLARMVLTALGFAIACFVGVKVAIKQHTSVFDLILYILPLVGPIVFAVFLVIKIFILINKIVDIYFPKVYNGESSILNKIFGYVVLFFVLYSANGFIKLIGAALDHQ